MYYLLPNNSVVLGEQLLPLSPVPAPIVHCPVPIDPLVVNVWTHNARNPRTYDSTQSHSGWFATPRQRVTDGDDKQLLDVSPMNIRAHVVA